MYVWDNWGLGQWQFIKSRYVEGTQVPWRWRRFLAAESVCIYFGEVGVNSARARGDSSGIIAINVITKSDYFSFQRIFNQQKSFPYHRTPPLLQKNFFSKQHRLLHKFIKSIIPLSKTYWWTHYFSRSPARTTSGNPKNQTLHWENSRKKTQKFTHLALGRVYIGGQLRSGGYCGLPVSDKPFRAGWILWEAGPSDN